MSLSSILNSLTRDHEVFKNQHLIDFKLSLLIFPFLALGSKIGVTLNALIPTFYISVFFTIVSFIFIVITASMAVK
jgi:uncharacterized membrane protein YfcA